jgi:hypothetical protein
MHLDGLFSKNKKIHYWVFGCIYILVRIAGSERPLERMEQNTEVDLQKAAFQVLV